MLRVYIADTTALFEESVFWYYLDRVDETRKEKVWQCRNEEDQKRSLLAGYLIQVGMKDWIGEESGLQMDAAPLSLAYTYGENGKPFLKDYKEVRFSISHSGKYVMAAFSNREIGIDVQKHRENRFHMADRFFSQEDKALLERLGAENLNKNFYRIWTIKEAYMKLTGEGMRQGLDTTIVEPAGEGFHFGRIRRKDGKTENAYFVICDKLDEYSIAVCSEDKITDIYIREIEIKIG